MEDDNDIVAALRNLMTDHEAHEEKQLKKSFDPIVAKLDKMALELTFTNHQVSKANAHWVEVIEQLAALDKRVSSHSERLLRLEELFQDDE